MYVIYQFLNKLIFKKYQKVSLAKNTNYVTLSKVGQAKKF